MKNGFTMIELIFVLVILGILSAVAIPKIAAVNKEKALKEASEHNKSVESSDTNFNKDYPNTIYSSK